VLRPASAFSSSSSAAANIPRYAAEAFHDVDYKSSEQIMAHFNSSIANTFAHADANNRAGLAVAFPEMARAYTMWQEDREGLYRMHGLD
jgi:hypothetical protein